MRRNQAFIGILFILPSLIGFLGLIFIPVIGSVLLGFFDWNLFSGVKGLKFTGLSNYINLAGDDLFIVSLVNNIKFSLITVPAIIVVSLLLAVLLNRDIYGKSVVRGLFFFPYVSNIVAICIVWMVLFNPQSGPINMFLRHLGVANPHQWLASSKSSLNTIIIINIWLNIGYIMVIYVAALQNVPESLYEAAKIDGANALRRFLSITLPAISPTTFFALIITLINSFKNFAPVNILTQGGPGNSSFVLVYYVYLSAFRHYKMGYGSALALGLFAIVFFVTIIQWQGQKKWVNTIV